MNPDHPDTERCTAEFIQCDDCSLAHRARIALLCAVLGAVVVLAGVWVA